MSDEKEMIIRRAVFGKQVDNFMSSEIGRYLLARAEDESEQALKDFKSCDPSDLIAVTAIQNKLNQAENFKAWLEEAVVDGMHALQIIEERE